jgi:hypothetical protein
MPHIATIKEKRRFEAVKKWANENGLTRKNGSLTTRGYEVAILLALTDFGIVEAVVAHKLEA